MGTYLLGKHLSFFKKWRQRMRNAFSYPLGHRVESFLPSRDSNPGTTNVVPRAFAIVLSFLSNLFLRFCCYSRVLPLHRAAHPFSLLLPFTASGKVSISRAALLVLPAVSPRAVHRILALGRNSITALFVLFLLPSVPRSTCLVQKARAR